MGGGATISHHGAHDSPLDQGVYRLALRRKGRSRMKSAMPPFTEDESPPLQLSIEEQRPTAASNSKPTTQRPSPMPPSTPVTVPPQAAFATQSSQRFAPGASRPEEPARIAVRNLEAGYGNHKVLKSINMDVPPRSVTAIMG